MNSISFPDALNCSSQFTTDFGTQRGRREKRKREKQKKEKQKKEKRKI
jgi:hypothetical protein